MNPAERNACARLRLFRENMGFAQEDFARRIGITRNQLSGIEYAQNPLQYRVAWRVREVFGLSISWLVNGKAPPNEADLDPWPELSSLPKSNILLSKIAASLVWADPQSTERRIAEKKWFDYHRKLPPYKTSRSICAAVLKGNLSGWLAALPDDKVDDFGAILCEYAESALTELGVAPETALQYRHLAIIQGQMRGRIQKDSHSAENKTQSTLDKRAVLSDDVGVKTKDSRPKNLPGLLERIRVKTSERGQKTALAKALGVSRQAVDQWLSSDAKPSADLTFKLLNWVEQQERQK